MKRVSIFVFLLLSRYCLAPHIACPKEQPFISKGNKCGSFNDICMKYRSEECEFGIRACEQCPLSNFSSAILDRVLRIMYGGEAKTGSQPRNETKPIQECPTNRLLWSCLIIMSLLLILSTAILLYLIYQYIRARNRRNHERSYINLLSLGNQNDLDSVNEKLKKHKESQKYFIVTKLEEIAKNQKDHIVTKLEDITKNQKDPIITKLDNIANEISILPSKMKSGKPTEISISWKDAENGFVPSGAIDVGNSCFIARAQHKREYIPGKLIPNDKCVYIGYGGQEISKSRYQVLVDTSILNKPYLDWQNAYCQDIPPGAIIGGTDDGKALYIAKDENEGENVVGKFQPEHGGAYFPIKDREVYKKEPVPVLCYSRM